MRRICFTALLGVGLLVMTAGVSSADSAGEPPHDCQGHGPPQEALDACKNLNADAACTVDFGDHTMKGTCRAPQGKPLACAPNGPPPEAIDACSNLASGASCSFTMHGNNVTGTCHGPADKPLACMPKDAPPPPPN